VPIDKVFAYGFPPISLRARRRQASIVRSSPQPPIAPGQPFSSCPPDLNVAIRIENRRKRFPGSSRALTSREPQKIRVQVQYVDFVGAGLGSARFALTKSFNCIPPRQPKESGMRVKRGGISRIVPGSATHKEFVSAATGVARRSLGVVRMYDAMAAVIQ